MLSFPRVKHQPELRLEFIFPLGVFSACDRGGEYVERQTTTEAVVNSV